MKSLSFKIMRSAAAITATLLVAVAFCQPAVAQLPALTPEQCQGSAMPYPAPAQREATPDTLTALAVSHVGRHGARYLSSDKATLRLRQALSEADSLGSITPAGKRLMAFTDYLLEALKGRWGALDSLGVAEQQGLARRMHATFPHLFKDGRVHAISSRVPRCVNSMFTFLYQISRLGSKVDITTASGPMENPLMRPFAVDEAYLDFIDAGEWRAPLNEYEATVLPLGPLMRVLGPDFAMEPERARALSMDFYKIVAGMSAMGIHINPADWFTPEEYRALWSVNNLSQYLQRTATTVSTIPAEIASPLLIDVMAALDRVAEGDKEAPAVTLRFGHAETLMPLLSLMRLPEAYYLTNYFDTVDEHWQNFHLVPMAANVQLILFKHKRSGRLYVRVDLNEKPVALDPARPDDIYLPWETVRARFMRCIPIYLQPA